MIKRTIAGAAVLCFLVASAQAQPPADRYERHQTRREQTNDRVPVPRNDGQLRRIRRDSAGKVEGLKAPEQPRKKNEGAHLWMENSAYNFGDVKRKGGDLVHDFQLVNDGSVPLVITRVITSCSCLKASFPKQPVLPGSSSMIRITYEPHKSEPGTFHKVIQVYSNSVDGRHIITVQGNSLDPDKM